jgi:integrase
VSTQGSIRKDASGAWFFIVDIDTADGRRRQLRRRGFSTKKAAQDALTTARSEMMNGPFVMPSRLTLAVYLNKWLDALPASGRRPSTVAGYKHLMMHDVIPAIGGVDLQALTALHLDRLYADLLARGLAMSTVRKVHVVLGKALSDAERKAIVNRNVARLATPPASSAAKAPEMKFWTPQELSTFLTSISGHHHYALIHLAALTGLRRGELAGLRWTDVDLKKDTISVRQATTVVNGRPVTGDVKTKRSRRVVDIDAGTVTVLRAWARQQKEQRILLGSEWESNGLVFTMPTGAAWHPDSISQAFERLVSPASKARAEALLTLRPRIRFHDLRHTHASHLLAAGVNVKVVSERLGHASVAFTLDTYAHVMPGQQAEAAAAVSALLQNSVTIL